MNKSPHSPQLQRHRLSWSRGVIVVASIGFLGLLSSSQAVPIAPERSAAHLFQLPLTFELNQGQTDDRVDFLARGPNYNIFLTATEAVFALPRAPAMRMQLVGSAVDPRVHGVDALPGKINYFHGKDVASWQTKVPTYQRAKYSAVYPGVDLVYYGQSQQLEYDFIVAPGADPNTIKLAFAGVEQTTIDAKGDLVLKTAGGPLAFQKPIIYQIDGGRRHTVEGGYAHRSPHQIGFRVGAYDRTRPLIIDPVLSYSTYLGGSGIDAGSGIAVDATGAVYVTGSTTSTAFQPANSGNQDAVVVKLSADGSRLIYSTYLGGSGEEEIGGIAVDLAGAAYISGATLSADFPQVNALQPLPIARFVPDENAFVAKLAPDGSALMYTTFLGGTGENVATDIGVGSL